VRFGVFTPQGWRGDLRQIEDPVDQFEAMINVAKVADSLPTLDSVWVYDHFHTIPTPQLMTTFECWTATTALARATSRVHVGQMVGCNGYRNPALYAKIASTVDVASHGRLYAGIGAGWYEHEWRAYGYEWNDTPVRMRKFREAVQIIHKMWTEEYPTFEGTHYHIDKPINEPKHSGKGKVPLWIGGGGEQVTLKLVAQYGDACNVAGDSETVRHKLDVLRGHCEKAGRNYDDIIKSSQIRIFLTEPGDDPEKATADYRGDHYPWERFQSETIVAPIDRIRTEVERLQGDGIDYVIIYVTKAAYEPDLVTYVSDEIVAQFLA